MKTIDTTGAGDAFVGALLVSIAKDNSLVKVLLLFFFSTPYSLSSFLNSDLLKHIIHAFSMKRS